MTFTVVLSVHVLKGDILPSHSCQMENAKLINNYQLKMNLLGNFLLATAAKMAPCKMNQTLLKAVVRKNLTESMLFVRMIIYLVHRAVFTFLLWFLLLAIALQLDFGNR